jgi:hypothetical protein
MDQATLADASQREIFTVGRNQRKLVMAASQYLFDSWNTGMAQKTASMNPRSGDVNVVLSSSVVLLFWEMCGQIGWE